MKHTKMLLSIRLEKQLIEQLREIESTSLIRFSTHVEIALKEYLKEYLEQSKKNSIGFKAPEVEAPSTIIAKKSIFD